MTAALLDPPITADLVLSERRSRFAPIWLADHGIEIPGGIDSLADFTAWVRSDEFPRRGRFDWVRGRIEVELEPPGLMSHGVPKTEFCRVVCGRADEEDLGIAVTSRIRFLSSEGSTADVSFEPDVALLSHEAVLTGRVSLTPDPRRPDDAIDVVGPPDLVIEILSDSSVGKDTVRLPRELFLLGVAEYWLADCRGESSEFDIHARGEEGFEPVPADADGFAPSAVLGRSYRLTRDAGRSGLPRFRLLERDM